MATDIVGLVALMALLTSPAAALGKPGPAGETADVDRTRGPGGAPEAPASGGALNLVLATALGGGLVAATALASRSRIAGESSVRRFRAQLQALDVATVARES